MNKAKKNYIFQVIYQLLTLMFPLITAPYVTRTLGASNLGIYTYSLSVATVFLKVAELGIVNHGSRSIASVQDNEIERSKVFSNIYIIQAFSSLLMTLIYIAYVFLIVKEDKCIGFLQTISVISSLFNISWLYMGMENFKKIVFRDTAVKILSLFCIFIFVREKNDLWKYACILLVSSTVGYLTLWFEIKKYVVFFKPSIEEIKKHIKPILILFIPTIAVTLYTTIDKVMLGSISGKSQVAYYQYAATLASIPLGFITSFGNVMMPHMASMSAKKEKSVVETINKSMLFIMFLSSAFAFGEAAISREIIPLYYGDEFIASVPLLILLSIKLPFMSWASVIRTQCLIPENRDKEYIISLFCGAAINLSMNFFLISKFDAIGAVIATIFAEIAVCVAQTTCVWKRLHLGKTLLHGIGFPVIGVIMYSVVRIVALQFETNVLTLLFEVLIGASIYLVLSFFYYCYVLKKSSIRSFYILVKDMLTRKKDNN